MAGIVFALAPWVSLGFATPFSFGIAAALMRSWLLWLCTVVFSAGFVAIFATSTSEDGTTEDMIFNWALGINLVGGGILAAVASPFLVRQLSATGVGAGRPARSRGRLPRDPVARAEELVARQMDSVAAQQTRETVARLAEEKRRALAHDPALRTAVGRRERRRTARVIATDQPQLADELRIGRPDLGSRDFDDGGLIDVNGVPARMLADLPGFDAAMAERVVAARERHGPLTSGAELVVYADVPNKVVAKLADRLIYRSG